MAMIKALHTLPHLFSFLIIASFEKATYQNLRQGKTYFYDDSVTVCDYTTAKNYCDNEFHAELVQIKSKQEGIWIATNIKVKGNKAIATSFLS